MNELTVREYLDNRAKYIEQGRAIESNVAQQAAREKALAEKIDELQEQGLSFCEAKDKAEKWLAEYSVAMKSRFRRNGNQQTGSRNHQN